jgi:hypothetical protein
MEKMILPYPLNVAEEKEEEINLNKKKLTIEIP